MEIKIGDIVRLKSGGPHMTVVMIREASDIIICGWFDASESEYSQIEVHRRAVEVDK